MIRTRDRASAQGLLPRMEARPRKDGLITYRYHPAGGKPITLGTDREAAIRKVLDLNRRGNDEGTVGALWRQYQQSGDWARLGDGTKKRYEECWRQLKKTFEAGHVAQIKPQHIARYLRVERKSAPVVANREVAVLSNLFNLAVEMGDIDRNPCREVKRNPESPRSRLVEKEELTPFVEWALKQGPSAVVITSMAEFCALTGNRRMEFLKLHWPQVDDQLIRLQRGKQRGGKAKRELVAISAALQAVLDRMRAIEGYNPMGAVFRAPRTGNAYSDAGFKTMWSRLIAAGIEAGVVKERFTFHDLRAHYTTYFKLRFGDLPDLHADPATTARVYERSRETKRQAL